MEAFLCQDCPEDGQLEESTGATRLNVTSYMPFSFGAPESSKLNLQLIYKNAWNFLAFETVLYCPPPLNMTPILMRSFSDFCALTLIYVSLF